MKVALVGAELEENLALRYMAAALEHKGHSVEIVGFNSPREIRHAVKQVISFGPQITGLSMVFTSRGLEFCELAQALRDGGYRGHVIAGGPFASFNCERLLRDFPAFDSVALGEGEELICVLADDLEAARVPGLCRRRSDGSIVINPSTGNSDNLDALPFPKRTSFHEYFGKPISSVLSSRGCWRNCAFCSINAWYKRVGGKRFRLRSVENIVIEMKELYVRHGVRIFNFQDDNFFLPKRQEALQRIEALRAGLQREGVKGIAIAIKARPDSITYESIQVLHDLGLFRVFLGVENASENGLRNLNRRCTRNQIVNSLRILNEFDVHVAFNLLMFEPDTILDDILVNLRFMGRHVENPMNFCRAEPHAGTGLEAKLRSEGRLLGDYFGLDYRLKDQRSETFHRIANYAFFDRNFNNAGLHYFSMEIDFKFHLLQRFDPEVVTETLRGAVHSFVREVNLDTYKHLCRIYDFVAGCNPNDQAATRDFAAEMREQVDATGRGMHAQGEGIMRWLNEAYGQRGQDARVTVRAPAPQGLSFLGCRSVPYRGLESLRESKVAAMDFGWANESGPLGAHSGPIPYHTFKKHLDRQRQERG